jgi:hypothetical protein
MKEYKLSDQVRSVAKDRYVLPLHVPAIVPFQSKCGTFWMIWFLLVFHPTIRLRSAMLCGRKSS